MITELAPAFALTVRGYDRAQVDDYVDVLREWLGNATLRMEAAESEAARLREQMPPLRIRVAQLERQFNDSPPRTIAALGDRLTQILRQAEEGAGTVLADAEAEAVAILGRARQEAADLVRDAHDQRRDSEALAEAASEQAAAVVRQAEARASDAANRLVTDAESRAAEREAQSLERSRAMVAEAEAQRERILANVKVQQTAVRTELERLVSERDGVRDGLARLRESLHRTVSELSGDEQ